MTQLFYRKLIRNFLAVCCRNLGFMFWNKTMYEKSWPQLTRIFLFQGSCSFFSRNRPFLWGKKAFLLTLRPHTNYFRAWRLIILKLLAKKAIRIMNFLPLARIHSWCSSIKHKTMKKIRIFENIFSSLLVLMVRLCVF